uniref:Uncharacterized protein n=1 Tax=Culex quinquefasciatus TaxID=7176 RepID=A0A1S4JIL7_CULQU
DRIPPEPHRGRLPGAEQKVRLAEAHPQPDPGRDHRPEDVPGDHQGNRQCHQEAAGRGQRGGRLHSGLAGQTGGRAAQEGVCQVFQKVQHHPQGVLQGGRGQRCFRECFVPDTSDESNYDHGEEQVRMRRGGGGDGAGCDGTGMLLVREQENKIGNIYKELFLLNISLRLHFPSRGEGGKQPITDIISRVYYFCK